MTATHHRAPARLRGDGGSALLLYPTAVFIVLVLGAIAVDLSAVHLAKRQLLDVADAAANDAVTAGVDPAAYRATGRYDLDPVRVAAVVSGSVRAHDPDGRITVVAATVGPGAAEVTVELEAHSRPVFSGALPGGGAGSLVRATVTATAAHR